MPNGQLRQWLLWSLFFITLFKGNYCSNEAEIEKDGAIATNIDTNRTYSWITPGVTSHITEKVSESTTDIWAHPSESTAAGFAIANRSDSAELFHVTGLNSSDNGAKMPVNVAIMTNPVNVSYEEQSWNETAKTNYTVMAEAVGSALEEGAPFWLQKSAAVGAGIFLVSAVLGYFSCVGYRRFLQRKYGNSQILVAEEVYDTTDLRYFEI